jgi:DNA-binding transcriptional LysR family regulator
VAATVPHFLLAPHLLRGTDLTLIFPRRLAAVVGGPFGLEVRPLPLAIPPFTAQMLWPVRRDRDPALAWLRERVGGIVGYERR